MWYISSVYQLLVIGDSAEEIDSFVVGNAVGAQKLARELVDTPGEDEVPQWDGVK